VGVGRQATTCACWGLSFLAQLLWVVVDTNGGRLLIEPTFAVWR